MDIKNISKESVDRYKSIGNGTLIHENQELGIGFYFCSRADGEPYVTASNLKTGRIKTYTLTFNPNPPN